MPGWEVVSPPSMAILTFRFVDGPEADLERLNAQLVRQLRESGVAMLSSTMLRGQYVMRLCPINPRTTTSDIDRTLDALQDLARSLR